MGGGRLGGGALEVWEGCIRVYHNQVCTQVCRGNDRLSKMIFYQKLSVHKLTFSVSNL